MKDRVKAIIRLVYSVIVIFLIVSMIICFWDLIKIFLLFAIGCFIAGGIQNLIEWSYSDDTPSEKFIDYTVKEGDTLYWIGVKHGMEWYDIVKINKIKNPDLIYPGQVLKVYDR